MTELYIQIPELKAGEPGVCVERLSRLILQSAAIQLYRAEVLGSEQASELANIERELFLLAAGETPLEPPETSASLLGSRYLARVLWALFEGLKKSLVPMTAAEIAKFVSSNSDVQIEETNTARFFRECRTSGQFQQYWSVTEEGGRRRYTLSDEGRDVLLNSLA